MENQKSVYIVGGPNGAGKTTFVEQFLPNYAHVNNFVNADHIASGISPLNSNAMNIKAGKIMLELIKGYESKNLSFGFETTLSGRRWIKLFHKLKAKGYQVHLFFLDLSSLKLSLARVKYRIETGGHMIPKKTIIRRYPRSRNNFWNIYKKISDTWTLFDNSESKPEIAAACKSGKLEIYDNTYYNHFIASLNKSNDK